MKTPIKLALVVVAALVSGAAVSSLKKPVAPYNPEQIQGNVRVVLLRVDRTTLFSDEGFASTKPQKIHAIPGLSYTYAVELLGDEPVKQWIMAGNGDLVSLDGKPIGDTEPENISGGGNKSAFEYGQYIWGVLKKPAVTNPKRTHVFETWKRGLRVPGGKIDLRITTGFNEHKEEFVFKDIPVE
jgi:hypothetical protein